MIKKLLSLILALSVPAHAGFTVYGTGAATTVTVLDYTSGSDFTYTASQIEFTDGGAKLKSQYASDVLFAATYGADLNGVYSKFSGVLTATTAGTVAVASGEADLSSGDGVFKKLQYQANLNFPMDNVGAVRMKVTPDYTGTPGTRQWYFNTSMALASAVNQVFAEHHTDGKMYYYIYNDSGATISAGDFAWAPTADVQVELYFFWNTTTGSSKMFIGGVEKVAYTNTGTRANRITYFNIGASQSDTSTDHADFRVDDVVLYNAVQETTAYTPSYTVSATKYLTSDPFVEQTTGVTVASWVGVTGVQSLSGSDTIKCQIRDDGALKYHNGSAWVASDGTYAQADTIVEINDQIATAPVGSIKMRCGLHSAAGATTPTLSSIVLEYM